MIIPGAPGKLTPYALYVGVDNCISYHNEGRFNPRCGSLHKMGAPAFVLALLTAQLLLPFSLLGFCSCIINSSLLLKYNESAVAGVITVIFGFSNTVPLGIMGSNESRTGGNNFAKSSALKKLLALV